MGQAVDIALVTEGTYPQAMGGVSVWCDGLIRGLPEHRFVVHAVCATGREGSAWPPPPNLAGVHLIPLWGEGPAAAPGRAGADFAAAHAAFLGALLDPSEAATTNFGLALHGLFRCAQRTDLRAALASSEAVARLASAWEGNEFAAGRPGSPPPPPSLADAVEASTMLEHLLRPLGAPPPRADLCHTASGGLSVLVALAAKWARGTPFVLTEHGVYLRERYLEHSDGNGSPALKALLLRFYRLLAGVGYREAALITPGSEYNRRWALRGGAEPDRVRPVYNGLDLAAFRPSEAEPAVPTLTWLGRVDPLKDLQTLVRAFALVREQLPTARLRLFGPTPAGNEAYRDRCLALIRELGLEEAARLEGRVASVLEAYHAGHVVVLTSISEGFPYSVIEAMAAGRPMVATDVGGVREAVADTGFLVPPRDPTAVACACVALLTDDRLRQDLGLAARARVLASFAQDKFIETYRTLYGAVADAVGRRLPGALT